MANDLLRNFLQGVEKPRDRPDTDNLFSGVGWRCAKGGVDESAKFGSEELCWNLGRARSVFEVLRVYVR